MTTLTDIQCPAEKTTPTGPSLHAMWSSPADSATAQLFHQQTHALQAAHGAVHGNLGNFHV